MSEYHVQIWNRARLEAEQEVMRLTATLPGGRLPTESLLDYVERAKQRQGAAIARWMTACAELEAAKATTPQSRGARDE